jgi:hypothetical protein
MLPSSSVNRDTAIPSFSTISVCKNRRYVNRFPLFDLIFEKIKKILCYDTPFLQKPLEIMRKMWYDNIEQIPCRLLLYVHVE